jgi:hypothetical protein
MKINAIKIVKLIKVLLLAMSLLGLSGCSNSELELEDITGVWRCDSDNSIVEINLGGSNAKIKIGDNIFKVKIKEIDNDNEIVSVIVNGDSKMIWSIRRIWSDDKKKEFSLDLTLHDGTNDSLSFVRNL